MNKKDRIAIVLTLALPLLALTMSTDMTILILGIIFVYWAYRFIKNDISFLNIEEK